MCHILPGPVFLIGFWSDYIKDSKWMLSGGSNRLTIFGNMATLILFKLVTLREVGGKGSRGHNSWMLLDFLSSKEILVCVGLSILDTLPHSFTYSVGEVIAVRRWHHIIAWLKFYYTNLFLFVWYLEIDWTENEETQKKCRTLGRNCGGRCKWSQKIIFIPWNPSQNLMPFLM